MFILLSPAKTLEFPDRVKGQFSQARFLSESEKLIAKLRKFSPKKLGEMMELSEKLAELNVQRYHDFHTPFTPSNAREAIFVFRGDVYLGLQADSLDGDDLAFAQNHLGILSGLYGLLRPLDLIQEYRLEMGTGFAPSPSKKNLYAFWKDKITPAINAHLADQKIDLVLNLASKEYSKAIDFKQLKTQIVECDFLDQVNGQYKMVSFFAKKARGMMARYVIKNKITKIEDLQGFQEEGYIFDPQRSKELKLVFTRSK